MDTVIRNWPSSNPQNFSEHRPCSDSYIASEKMKPPTYHPTHDRVLPPPDQVIKTEVQNILIRNMHKKAQEKLKQKRAAAGNLLPEHECKQHRVST